MSIASEIQRLNRAKADIKSALESKGITVPSSLKIDGYAQLINDYLQKKETRVVAKYYVTESTKTQMILGYRKTGQYSIGVTTAFTSVYVDGNEIEISDANISYTFDTIGEHTVKYELKDPTKIYLNTFNGYLYNYKGVEAVSITIPDSVTSIGNSAFNSCSSLTSIDIPSGVTSIGSSAFEDCTSLTSVTIPNSVTSIGDSAFRSCRSLTNVTLPNSVATIDNYTFEKCSSLTSVDIPDSVTSIGNSAFNSCSSLTSCTIGGGVASIGQYVFSYCSGLTSIVSNRTTAPTIKSDTFYNINTGGTLTVPSGSSGYDVWMQNANYYLGLYEWTEVEL